MLKEIVVPDIGSYSNVPVIEVLVSPGDTVQKEASLITLETEKATMEVPSPFAGVIKSLNVKLGDKVSEGSVILTIETAEAGAEASAGAAASKTTTQAPVEQKSQPASIPQTQTQSQSQSEVQTPVQTQVQTQKRTDMQTSVSTAMQSSNTRSSGDNMSAITAHASPGVRRFAREFGVDIARVVGTGPKDRILKTDIQNYIKHELARTQAGGGAGGGGLGLDLPSWPQVDFAKFGEITKLPLSRIKKISGSFLHRNWVMVPHITQFDEADITALEQFRKEHQPLAEKQQIKLTLLPFIMKAVAATLSAFPTFNASLDMQNGELILKKYIHIGVAVDTPNGLVVPVIRNVDKKGLFDLARELAEVSSRARAGQLSGPEMQGSSFSISSLGGVGGTAFTPIINVPDVAILGVSKAEIKPVYVGSGHGNTGGEFIPRLHLPLSLSYDHRVIDGAEGARFTSFLASQLADIRRLLL